MKVKEESEKVGLKLNIQKTKIMASGPINSWQIDGETVETVTDFILGGEFEQTLGDSEGQGSLVCCRPWDHRVRHDWATEQKQSDTVKAFSHIL